MAASSLFFEGAVILSMFKGSFFKKYTSPSILFLANWEIMLYYNQMLDKEAI